MKRLNIIKLAVAISIIGVVSYSSYNTDVMLGLNKLTIDNIESITSCEITKGNGQIIFECVGEAGDCDASKLGYNLTCSGKEVKK